MATEADVLRSITSILQSGERREQYKVQSALAMMQFTSQQRQQDIAQTQANLDLVSKSVQQQKPQVAAEFLASSGIGGIYEQGAEDEPASDSIGRMVKNLRSKQYFGRKFDETQAESMAAAVWNYYNAQDPNSILKLAGDLHEANRMANNPEQSGLMSKPQKQLYEAFAKLHKVSDLKTLTMSAKKTRDAESQVRKEIFDFTKGDYDISDLSGIYSGIPGALDELDFQQRMEEQPPAAEFTQMETTREALRDAEARLKGLQNKMDTNMATDDEKEEFYELPNLIDRFRSEVGESSASLQDLAQDELVDLDKQIEDMRDAGLSRTRQYKEIKRKRVEKRREFFNLTRQSAQEKRREVRSREIENVSELLGVPASEAESHYETAAKSRGVPDYGFGSVYPGMREAPEGRAGEEWSLKPEGGWVGTRGQEFIELLEAIGLKQP